MRTICIIGTDWSGPRPEWVRQPFLDGGRLTFDRMHRPDWDNVFHELGDLARVDSLAVGIRGLYDTGAADCLSVARAAYQATNHQPTLMPWFDTVGLPDIAGEPGEAHPFDFANPEHIRWGWERYAKVFFDRFGDLTLERSPRGKVLCVWWGIETHTGHGFRNQQHAQNLLDYVDHRLIDAGLGGADHIVDQSWATLVPNLNAYAVHDWFNPWGITPQASSIRRHNGVTVGVTVPSFYQIINPDGNADTVTASLAAFRAAKVDYVLLEGGTDFQEGAEFMRDSTGNTSKLDAVREHIRLTTGIVEPTHKDTKMLTATFSLRRAERLLHPTKPGYFTSPFPGSTTGEVLSVNPPDGRMEPRPIGTSGPFESWREDGNRSVFDEVFGYTFAIPLVD